MKNPNKKKKPSHILAFTTFAAIAPVVVSAHAEEINNSVVQQLLKEIKQQEERLRTQEQVLRRQEEAILQQRRVLQQEQMRFNHLRNQAAAVTGVQVETPDSSPASAASAYAVPGGSRVNTYRVPNEVGVAHKPNTESPPEIPALVEEGGVLLRKGRFVVTPALEYQNSSATRVDINGFSIIPALNIGNFEITRVSRDTLIPSVSFRYGITNRFEIDAKVPYLWRSDTTKTRPIGVPGADEVTTDIEGHNIGDVEFGAHYQLNRGSEGWPYLVGNLRFKTITGESPFDITPDANGFISELPTGTGFYALQPSITAIYPSDPVVYYANLGYLYNVKRDVGANYGTIDPGDAVSGSFGMSLALNDSASISFGYSHNTVFKTTQRGVEIPNSSTLQVGSLDLGYTYVLSPRTSLSFTVSAGVTDDAPDVRLIFRVPISFDFSGK